MLLSEVKSSSEDATTKKTTENDAIIIVLSENEADEEPEINTNEIASSSITVDGNTYSTEAIITIPKIKNIKTIFNCMFFITFIPSILYFIY